MLRRCTLSLSLSTLALLLALALAVPSGAMAAGAYTEVLRAYNQASTGTLSPCAFSSPTLEAALKEAPAYDYQYAADLTDAIQAALAARADGQCATGAAKTVPGSLGASAHLGSDSPLPGSATSSGSGGLPLVLVVAFGLAAACLLALGAWLAVNALGFDPRPGRAARHSLREAEYRMSAGWNDLADRLRR